MKQLLATTVALFVGFCIGFEFIFAIGLSLVGFIMSKTHGKKEKQTMDKEARIIEGEYSDVTNY